ncbi:MAG: hypothetical protein F6K65_23140 [Moorea sp. SIO3C2]|nr:hypothetical protein [Moorena sp. SIO3C2]
MWGVWEVCDHLPHFPFLPRFPIPDSRFPIPSANLEYRADGRLRDAMQLNH